MKVKGKCLNSFLGIIKSDLPRLAVEGFPQELNKQLNALMFLPRQDLVWFDIQIDQRVATLKGNFFSGYNLGQNYYKLGFLCLIGIAHLPDTLSSLRYYRIFELRPTLSTDLSEQVLEELDKGLPKHAITIIKYLFCALRTVAAQVIHKVGICGNIEYERELPPQFMKKKTEEKTATNRYAPSSDEENDHVFVVDEELKRRDEELKYEMRDSVSDPKQIPHLNPRLNKKASVVSFNSSLVNGIQHNGGVHDTVIMDEMIDKNGTS